MGDPQIRTCPRSSSRREFLQQVSAGSIGFLACRGKSEAAAAIAAPGIPSHLPRRLAICYYGWDWIASALPDEPYGNLEQTIKETKDRGFNCVRAEMGLNWMFDLQGRRRGKLKFQDWIPGFSNNLQCVDGKGGGEHDVFERVMRLFELADKFDLYVITTSWEYQDAISHLAEAYIRDEIIRVPYSERLMLLALQYTRLLTELKKRGLHRRIAQIELINELNTPPIVCSSPGAPTRQTWSEWIEGKRPSPPCDTDRIRALAYEAVGFLRNKHPDLLVTVDGLVASSSFQTLFPENAQVADHHVYADGIVTAFWRAAGIGLFDIRHLSDQGPDLQKNELLRSMLKPNTKTWAELKTRATHVRQVWWGIAWLYENLDNEKFDEWCATHYSEYKHRIKESIDKQFQAAAQFARPRKLPLVVDEGFILYPPLHSHFVMTPEGRWGEETGVNAAISTGHWGIMMSGYFRPNTPSWKDEGQCEWARKLNRRILLSSGTMDESPS